MTKAEGKAAGKAAKSHTPGPWTIENDAPTEVLVVAGRNGRDAVATVNTLVRGGWEANARLIAAAPGMLEALRELAAHFAGFVETNGPESQNICAYCDGEIYSDEGAEVGHSDDCAIIRARAILREIEGGDNA